MSMDLGVIAKDLGVTTSFTLVFAGTVVGNDTVRWDIDQSIGVYVAAHDVTLDSIKGQFTTLLMPLVPAPQQDGCDGLTRAYDVQLDSQGTGNELTLDVHRRIALSDIHDTIHVTNLSFSATAGLYDPPKSVQIIVGSKGQCDVPLAEGKVATLTALANGFGGSTAVTYRWSVQGAVALTPLTSSTIEVKLPSPPPATPVAVAVSVSDETGDQASDHVDLTIVSSKEAGIAQAICQYRNELNRIQRPYLPGDPRVWAQDPAALQREAKAAESAANRLIAASQRLVHAIARAR
jgi:hypothetical protein